jgi:hypothetical protein
MYKSGTAPTGASLPNIGTKIYERTLSGGVKKSLATFTRLDSVVDEILSPDEEKETSPPRALAVPAISNIQNPTTSNIQNPTTSSTNIATTQFRRFSKFTGVSGISVGSTGTTSGSVRASKLTRKLSRKLSQKLSQSSEMIELETAFPFMKGFKTVSVGVVNYKELYI